MFSISKPIQVPKSTSTASESTNNSLMKCMKQANLLNYLLCLHNSYTHKTKTKLEEVVFGASRKVEELNTLEVEQWDAESCLPPLVYQKMKGKIISDFLANHGSQKRPRSRSKCSKKRKSQQKQSSQDLPLNISNRAKEHTFKSLTRVTKDQVCSNTTRPVGRFKEGMGSDTVSRNEDSDEFETEINPLNTNFSEMNPFETTPPMKLLNKNSSLTSSERQNLCRKNA